MVSTRKIIIIVISLIVLGLIIWSIYLLTPRGYVILKIAPQEASLSIGEKDYGTVEQDQKIAVSPGTHTLELSRDEFSTETISVEVKDGETKLAVIALTPQTGAAWEILRSNPDSVAIFESFGSRQSVQNMKNLQAENPAYKELPINTREYYANACQSLKHPTDNAKKAVCVDLAVDHPTVEINARNALVDAGFNLQEDEIYFSVDKNKYNVLETDTYSIDHYKDLSAADKPTLIILVNFQEMASEDAYNAYLIEMKDEALASLKTAGYKLDNYYIAYVNPQLEQFNTDHDVSFPSVVH